MPASEPADSNPDSEPPCGGVEGGGTTGERGRDGRLSERLDGGTNADRGSERAKAVAVPNL